MRYRALGRFNLGPSLAKAEDFAQQGDDALRAHMDEVQERSDAA
jgi:hypothetical protein